MTFLTKPEWEPGSKEKKHNLSERDILLSEYVKLSSRLDEDIALLL